MPLHWVHRDPMVHVAMLRHAELFDTALMPLHAADTCFSDSSAMSFEKTALPSYRLLPIFVDRDCADNGAKEHRPSRYLDWQPPGVLRLRKPQRRCRITAPMDGRLMMLPE